MTAIKLNTLVFIGLSIRRIGSEVFKIFAWGCGHFALEAGRRYPIQGRITPLRERRLPRQPPALRLDTTVRPAASSLI
jgi:hypothetical protein